MTGWSAVTWTVARAGGFTSLVLLTLSVALGLALSMRWQRPAWPRRITNEMHSFLTLLSLAFLAVHGLAVWLDPFTRFNWNEIFIPFASHYRTTYMALGIVAAYLALAVWLSTQLRPWIGYALWRRLHGLAFGAYLLGLLHGIGTGSDTRTNWGMAIYAGSALLVGGLLCLRLLTPIGARGRRYPGLAFLTVLTLAGAALWTAAGPLQAGWNAAANNAQGNGSRLGTTSGAAAPSASSSSSASPSSGSMAPFTANLQGTGSQGRPDAAGNETITVNTTLSGGAQGTLRLTLQGTALGDGSLAVSGTNVALNLAQPAATYQGQARFSTSDTGEWNFSATLQDTAGAGSPATAKIQLWQSGDGQFQGTISVLQAAGGSGSTQPQT